MARYSKINSFNALQTLTVGEKSYQIFNLPQAVQTLGNIDQLPKSLKVLLENLLRFEDQKKCKSRAYSSPSRLAKKQKL